jgi:spermidine synthase
VTNPTPRAALLLVLLAAFVYATCGLVYELELVALGSYLLSDSVTEASVVLSVMVCAMGVGSLLAKRFTLRPAASFALIESLLALVGGLSVIALYGCYVWLGHYQAALVGFASLIGLLIVAEIPLLMTLMQRIRRQGAGRAVADLFAADYVGALVGGLAFPFLLLPTLGQLTGALLTGVVNTVAGGLIAFWLFRTEPAPRVRLLARSNARRSGGSTADRSGSARRAGSSRSSSPAGWGGTWTPPASTSAAASPSAAATRPPTTRP